MRQVWTTFPRATMYEAPLFWFTRAVGRDLALNQMLYFYFRDRLLLATWGKSLRWYGEFYPNFLRDEHSK